MTRRRVALALAALLVATGGCGVRPERSATPLTDVAPAPAPAQPRPGPEQVVLRVWMVKDDRVAAVERSAPRSTAQTALAALAEGPTESELAAGYRSALPARTDLRNLDAEPGVATVDLGDAVTAVTGQEQALAIAQVVMTVTELPEITAVEFVVSGDPVDVPLADGTLSTGRVTRADYQALSG